MAINLVDSARRTVEHLLTYFGEETQAAKFGVRLDDYSQRADGRVPSITSIAWCRWSGSFEDEVLLSIVPSKDGRRRRPEQRRTRGRRRQLPDGAKSRPGGHRHRRHRCACGSSTTMTNCRVSAPTRAAACGDSRLYGLINASTVRDAPELEPGSRWPTIVLRPRSP